MSVYIASGKGFYYGKEIMYDGIYQSKRIGYNYIWGNVLRNAKLLKIKEANFIIEKLDESAFIWSPYKEEPIIDKYKVIQRNDMYSWDSFDQHKILEWIAVKVKMESNSDAKYLSNRGKDNNNYYTFEEATKIARDKNMEMLIELETKMNAKNVIKQ